MFSSNTSQVSEDQVFVEDVFSTWLYTGNGSTQTINNGIDLAGKGGLVWVACRSNAQGNYMTDTVRGATKQLAPFAAAAQTTESTGLTAFSSTGFTVGSKADWNFSNFTYASWTFREQPKFFDIVTWTGNNAAGRQIAHNLQSTPGCIIVKGINDSIDWFVYHRGATVGSPAASQRGYLNSTTFFQNDTAAWNDTAPTSTNFTVGTTLNNSNYTYVAYIFAHNAGGFGLTGTDNVITCGSYVGNGSTSNTVTLGYEPQWLLIKGSDTNAAWMLFDVMRGMPVSPGGVAPNDSALRANSSAAETTAVSFVNPTATGFELTISSNETNADGNTYIYIAIRRGPMRTPTSGTSVFTPVARAGTSTYTTTTAGFPVDLAITKSRTSTNGANAVARLTANRVLQTSATTAEETDTAQARYQTNPFDNQTALKLGDAVGGSGFTNNQFFTYVDWMFRRAPGFMDVTCWTGNGTGNPRNHNLTVYPELVIAKLRSGGAGFGAWNVQNNINPSAKQTGVFNTTAAFSSSGATSPTATVFYPTDDQSGANYVTYLFASCPGVSKVGTYTGTGTTQTINCGFTAGSRFVMIKRTDSTGDWFIWDSARGIVPGNDPYLMPNRNDVEVTDTDFIDTAATGFEISSTAPAAINASGGTFIFLAIA